MKNLEDLILRELDKQKMKSEQIALIMIKLDNDLKKKLFLSYLIENRNTILKNSTILKEVNSYE
ncbi:MAG TPA: hypothetical protein DHV70_00330 [Firmicutes bacterium]|nr:MAG TPA: hypothetical protein [Caudoviricetes sp.]HCJ31334.1 hypothetical protein [Bacillota bacterium]